MSPRRRHSRSARRRPDHEDPVPPRASGTAATRSPGITIPAWSLRRFPDDGRPPSRPDLNRRRVHAGAGIKPGNRPALSRLTGGCLHGPLAAAVVREPGDAPGPGAKGVCARHGPPACAPRDFRRRHDARTSYGWRDVGRGRSARRAVSPPPPTGPQVSLPRLIRPPPRSMTGRPSRKGAHGPIRYYGSALAGGFPSTADPGNGAHIGPSAGGIARDRSRSPHRIDTRWCLTRLW